MPSASKRYASLAFTIPALAAAFSPSGNPLHSVHAFTPVPASSSRWVAKNVCQERSNRVVLWASVEDKASSNNSKDGSKLSKVRRVIKFITGPFRKGAPASDASPRPPVARKRSSFAEDDDLLGVAAMEAREENEAMASLRARAAETKTAEEPPKRKKLYETRKSKTQSKSKGKSGSGGGNVAGSVMERPPSPEEMKAAADERRARKARREANRAGDKVGGDAGSDLRSSITPTPADEDVELASSDDIARLNKLFGVSN